MAEPGQSIAAILGLNRRLSGTTEVQATLTRTCVSRGQGWLCLPSGDRGLSNSGGSV